MKKTQEFLNEETDNGWSTSFIAITLPNNQSLESFEQMCVNLTSGNSTTVKVQKFYNIYFKIAPGYIRRKGTGIRNPTEEE